MQKGQVNEENPAWYIPNLQNHKKNLYIKGSKMSVLQERILPNFI